MRSKVAKVLIRLGITPDIKGFRYICDASEIIAGNNEVGATELYEMIASINNTTGSGVSRAIRHAIEKVSDEDMERELDIVNCRKLSQFLYTLTYKLGGLEYAK